MRKNLENHYTEAVDNLVAWRKRYNKYEYPEKVVHNIFYSKLTMQIAFDNFDVYFDETLDKLSFEESYGLLEGSFRKVANEKSKALLPIVLKERQYIPFGSVKYETFIPQIQRARQGDFKELESIEFAYIYFYLCDIAIRIWCAFGLSGTGKLDAISKMTGFAIETIDISNYAQIEDILGRQLVAPYLDSKYFSLKKGINEKLEEINMLLATKKDGQAIDVLNLFISNLKNSPKTINDIIKIGEFGNLLTNMFTNFEDNDDLQFIVEIAFYAISKELNQIISPSSLYDRIIILYNGEDFLKETIIQTHRLEHNPLSRSRSHHMINHQVNDILMKMRYHDLVKENRFWRNGVNGSEFNMRQLNELTTQIQNGYFGENLGAKEIELDGDKLISKTFEYIAEKYSM